MSDSSICGNPDGESGRDGGVEYFLLYIGRDDLPFEVAKDFLLFPCGRSALDERLGEVGDVGSCSIERATAVEKWELPA